MSDLSQFEIAAYHEGAHALVQVLSPNLPPVLAVTIEVDGTGRVVPGEYAPSASGAEGRQARRAHAYGSMRMLLAGVIGELLATGRVDGCRRDFDKLRAFTLIDAVLGLEGFPVELADRVAVRLAAADDFDTTAAPVLAELAAAGVTPARLERALRAAEARMVTAFTGAEVLVRANWGAIEALAARLVQLGSITGELVEVVLERAHPRSTPPIGRGRDLIALLCSAEADPDVARAGRAFMGARH